LLYVLSNEDQGTGVVEYLGLTLQHYISQQVEYVISRRKQRLSPWHIIQHLSSLDACLIYSRSLMSFLSLTTLIRYGSIRIMRLKQRRGKIDRRPHQLAVV